MNKVLLIIASLSLTLFACGGTVKAPMVSSQEKASVDHNIRARAAFERGDIDLALKLSVEALRLSRSVEDTVGTSSNLVNIAAIYRVKGERASAHETLHELFDPPGPNYPVDALVKGYNLKTLLYIDEGDLVKAASWSKKSVLLCKSSHCDQMAASYNLMGRVMLLRDMVSGSIDYSKNGLKASAGDDAEAANSYRLMADAHIALKAYETAIGLYEDALFIDKVLGSSVKIALDLKGMAKASISAERAGDARKFLLRALQVIKSSRVTEGKEKSLLENEINMMLEAMEVVDK
jgi:tetratricopeptide (TPR) repeat protein